MAHEDFFHGLVLGLLAFGVDYYEIKSNREMGDGRPDIVDFITNGQASLIINTPAGADSLHDDSYIRKAAIKYRIPYITTMAAASATAEGIAAIKAQGGSLSVKSLQEFHKEITE